MPKVPPATATAKAQPCVIETKDGLRIEARTAEDARKLYLLVTDSGDLAGRLREDKTRCDSLRRLADRQEKKLQWWEHHESERSESESERVRAAAADREARLVAEYDERVAAAVRAAMTAANTEITRLMYDLSRTSGLSFPAPALPDTRFFAESMTRAYDGGKLKGFSIANSAPEAGPRQAVRGVANPPPAS